MNESHPEAARCSATGTRPFGPSILRVAGWPVESLEPLRATSLVHRIDRWIGNEEAIRLADQALAEQLRALVPKIEDRQVRGMALALKRALNGTTGPLPDRLIQGLLRQQSIRNTIGPGIQATAEGRLWHRAERSAIEQDHAVELQRASTALDRIVGSAQFQRALCLANPSLFRQWHEAQRAPVSRRNRQRLQSTLHRYLMRAVGRATPNGLWAGVAQEGATELGTAPFALVPSSCVTRVSPVLSVFLRGLDHLTRLRPCNIELTWRCNPTLRRVDDAQWEFGTFSQGFWVMGRIAHHAPLDVLKTFGAKERPRLPEIERALCESIRGVTTPLARSICENWIDAGILWSTSSLPTLFADTWQALDTTIESLPNNERGPWSTCRHNLRSIADRIELTIDTIEPEDLRDLLDAAANIVAALLGRYGATLRRNENVLTVDRTAPFGFSLSQKMIDRLAKRVRRYWAFDRYGLGEIETKIAIPYFFGAQDADYILLGALLSQGGETDPAQRAWSWQDRVLPRASAALKIPARAAFARWEGEIEPVASQAIYRLAADDSAGQRPVLPPGSALLLIGRRDADGDVRVRIGGITPEPCFFHSRFAHLFGEADAFGRWHNAGIAQAAARSPRLQFRDLAIRNHPSPNVTARPPSALPLIDLLDSDSSLLWDGRIGFNHRDRPVLSTADGRLTIASARSAAYLGGLDRMASVLASVSSFLGRPPLLAPIPRLTREIEAWHHLPRLMLDDDVISPERWTPPETFGLALAKARGSERLILWRRFVRARKLPDLVYTFQRHPTESTLATDSALGVELLGQQLQAHGPSLRIQELWPRPDDFVVRDQAGCRYVAELAVAWHADDGFWQDYTEGARLVQPEADSL